MKDDTTLCTIKTFRYFKDYYSYLIAEEIGVAYFLQGREFSTVVLYHMVISLFI